MASVSPWGHNATGSDAALSPGRSQWHDGPTFGNGWRQTISTVSAMPAMAAAHTPAPNGPVTRSARSVPPAVIGRPQKDLWAGWA